MPNPIFFIDGLTEQRILQTVCPGKPVRITGLNGKSVTLKAIAGKLAPLIKALGGRNYPIVILIDKEKRRSDIAQIADELLRELNDLGLHNEDIRVGVADQMIENWTISDWETFEPGKKKPDETEGVNGAAIIRKAKGSFSKSTDGVRFFLKARPEIVYGCSFSFKHFVDQLMDIECSFLNFEKPADD